jgi:hypothetical protein
VALIIKLVRPDIMAEHGELAAAAQESPMGGAVVITTPGLLLSSVRLDGRCFQN